MKKILGIFLLIFGIDFNIFAATATDPVVDFGTLTFTTDSPTPWSFAVTDKKTGTITKTSGTNAIWDPTGNYTPFNLTNLKPQGQARYIHVQIEGENLPEMDDSNCGKLSVTDMQVYPSNVSPLQYQFTKKSGYVYEWRQSNGLYLTFTATITPYPNKGTCTLTQSLSGWLRYDESSSSLYDVPSSNYIPVNFTFTVTLITSNDSLSHNTNAALNFGTFCKSTTQNQSLTVNADGSLGTNTVACAPTPATISADSFTVNLSSAPSYSVNLPATASLNGSNGGELTVSNFTTSCGNSPCTVTGGSGSFSGGGTINVPANSPVGDYEGTYGVSITY